MTSPAPAPLDGAVSEARLRPTAAAAPAAGARPASATNFWLNGVALVSLLVTLYVLRGRALALEADGRSLGVQDAVLTLLLATATPIILLDVFVLKVHRRATTGLDWDRAFAPDYARVATKLLGLAVPLGLIALAFWAFPEYHGTFYNPLWDGLRRLWVPLAVGAPIYVTLVDGIMIEPRDAYWQMGRVLLGKWGDARRGDVANLLRGWLVKAFFLPLMVVYAHNETRGLVHFDLSRAAWSNLRGYDFLYSLIFGVDLLFTTCGYILSLRVLDTQIRSAEPTMFGWVVALFCYQPFYGLMEAQFVRYGGDGGFGNWLGEWPTFRWVWAITILVLITFYSLATVAFGVRFSNLTHRGILTGGPFRFTKHPAYVSKNLSWWLVSVPWVSHMGPLEAVRHCLLLGCINTIYFLRAKTEERHLSRDPAYVAYALWMNENGMLRWLGRIPLFRYRAPAGAPAAPAPAAAE